MFNFFIFTLCFFYSYQFSLPPHTFCSHAQLPSSAASLAFISSSSSNHNIRFTYTTVHIHTYIFFLVFRNLRFSCVITFTKLPFFSALLLSQQHQQHAHTHAIRCAFCALKKKKICDRRNRFSNISLASIFCTIRM